MSTMRVLRMKKWQAGANKVALIGLLLCIPVLAWSATGRTSGQFEVSPSGSATYTIPLWTAPGALGIQPQLALRYDSNIGDGILGPGWSLSGQSQIVRCASTWAQDGALAEVALTLSDKFCLDGNRLRLTSGTYGADSSTYQTEIADFSEVIAHSAAGNGPAWFEVKRKNGLIYEYGNTVDSRIGGTGSSTPYLWVLNKVRDRRGNNMVIAYSSSSGSTVPSSIQYTQTPSSGSTYSHQVIFSYANNTSLSGDYVGYVAGGLIRQSIHLTGITVQSLQPSATTVRHYTLSYSASPSTARDRLTSVQQCSNATGADCLSPTTISYQDGQPGLANHSASTGTTSTSGRVSSADFDGDGKMDLVYATLTGSSYRWYVQFSTGSGFGPPVDTTVLTTVNDAVLFDDFLGTGRDDLLAPAGGVWRRYFWNGSNFGSSSSGLAYDSNRIPNRLAFASADLNGDGKPDLVWARTDNKLYTRLNTGSGGTLTFSDTATDAGSMGQAQFGGLYGNNGIAQSSVRRMDFNSDGRQDVILYLIQAPFLSFAHHLPLLSNGSTLTTGGSFAFGATPLPANWNDDSCTDFVDPAGGNTVYISPCNGATPVQIVSSDTTPAKVALDWDADGRTDALGTTGSSWTLYRSLGTSKATAVASGLSAGTGAWVVLDINGDGLSDWAFINSASANAVTFGLHNGEGVPPDLATAFTDGYGMSFSPVYVSIARDNYTKGADAPFPYKAPGPLYVVDEFSASNGVGGTYKKEFWYYDAWLHLQGRGFGGFRTIRARDDRNSLYSYTTYEREFPRIGWVDGHKVYQSDNATLISDFDNSFDMLILNGADNNRRQFPFVSSTLTTKYEFHASDAFYNGRAIESTSTSFNYDTSGNVTTLFEQVTDVDPLSPYFNEQWSSRTESAIAPQSGCLNLPTAITVTRTAPGVPSRSRATSYTPDYVNCRVTQEIIEPGNTTYQVTTDIGYDGFGNVNSTTVTGVGMTPRTTTLNWGSQGSFPVSIVNPLQQETLMGYDYALGVQTSQTDPNGLAVGWTYDSFGRRISETRPDNTSTSWTYASCSTAGCFNGNNRMTVTQTVRKADTSVFTDEVVYLDQFDRTLATSQRLLDGSYGRVEIRYDALGRTSQQSVPCFAASCTSFWNTFSYDVLNRVVRAERPISATNATLQSTAFEYRGRSTITTDAEGKATTKVVTVADTLARSADHNGYYQSFVYDAFGSLLSVSDSLANSLFTATYDYGAGAYQRTTADMDLGARLYSYNALGEITSSSDAKGQNFSSTYDLLSRPLTRVEPDGTTTWVWGDSGALDNIGQLATVSLPGYSEAYTYDSKGRLSRRRIVSDSTYDYDYTYSSTTGLLDTLAYPESTSSYRLKLQYLYQNGVVKQVADFNSSTVFWNATAVNPGNQVTQETLGNGVVTQRILDAVSGRVNHIQSGIGGGAALQNESYLFDRVGNLTQRQNGNLGLTENFFYDNLHRLDYSTLGSTTNLDLAYDPMGNITSRSDIASGASWTYHSTKKHAVTQAGSTSYTYSYDPNGNAITRNGYGITWTSYNYPSVINAPGKTLTFNYGPDRQRYRQVYSNGSTTETTMYIGGALEKVTAGNATDWRHYVSIGGNTIAVVNRQSTGTNTTRYMLEDHQDSISQILDSSGASWVSESFTAFGARRDANTWAGGCACPDLAKMKSVTRRGYTGHEAVGGVSMGLNHMNGRVQDAITGRFLSADPHISEPGNTQSYNRFSYVNNNPLTLTDPSGFAGFEGCSYDNCDIVESVLVVASTIPALAPFINIDWSSGNPSWLQPLPAGVWNYWNNGEVDDHAADDDVPISKVDKIEEVVVDGKMTQEKCVSPGSLGVAFGNGGTRTPDYLVATIPVLPALGLSATIDREGNVYVGPSVGVNWLSKSGRSAGMGWTGHSQVPTNQQLQDWLSGSSVNVGVGAGFTWSSPQSPGRFNPERFGTNLQVPGASIGWNFHVADINLTVCY